MKKTWSNPEVQELTISATATGKFCSPMGPGHRGPGMGVRPNGIGMSGGDSMSPDEFHPERFN